MTRIAIATADFYEESEVITPFFYLAGMAETKIYTPSGKPVTGKNGMTGLPVHGDLGELTDDDFDVLIIPGGFAPDLVRRVASFLEVVKTADAKRKTLAFICHGLWVAVAAGILENRTVTAVPVIKPEVIGAGALWSDECVVVADNLITAQLPKDIHAWLNALIAHSVKSKES